MYGLPRAPTNQQHHKPKMDRACSAADPPVESSAASDRVRGANRNVARAER